MHIKCLEWCQRSEHSVNVRNGWHCIGRVHREEKKTKDWALENPNVRGKEGRTQVEEWKGRKDGKRTLKPWYHGHPEKRDFQRLNGPWSQILQRILVKWRLKLSTQVGGENVLSEFCQSCFSGTALLNIVPLATHMNWMKQTQKVLSL